MEETTGISFDGNVVIIPIGGTDTPIGHLEQDGEEAILIIDDLHPHKKWGEWDDSLAALAEWLGPLWVVWPSNMLKTHIECWEKDRQVILCETISLLSRPFNSPAEAVRAGRLLLSLPKEVKSLEVSLPQQDELFVA